MLVQIDIGDKRIDRVSFLPVMINKRAQPQILTRDDPQFEEVVSYVREITESQHIATKPPGGQADRRSIVKLS